MRLGDRARELTSAAVAALLLCAASARADDLTIAPSVDGAVGAWLAAGPFFADPLALSGARDADYPPLTPRLGGLVRDTVGFQLLASADGRLDLKSLLRTGDNVFALLGARLHASRNGRLVLVLGVDDGVVVLLDGQELYRRNEARPVLHDDDAVVFDLLAGDHTLLVRLRQFAGPWQPRVRLLDADDLLPPRFVSVALPGTGTSSALQTASRMTSSDLSLVPRADGYDLHLRIRWPGGCPAGVDLPIRVQVSCEHGPTSRVLYESSLGAARATDRGMFDFEALLPRVTADDLQHDEHGGRLTVEAQVGDKLVTFHRPLLPAARATVARIDAALRDRLPVLRPSLVDADIVESSLLLARERIVRFVADGDPDTDATDAECRSVDEFIAKMEAGADPLVASAGPMRLGYRSPLDGQVHPFGLYVPTGWASSGKKYPLVVVLHGLNGLPMQMLRIFFGQDDPAHLAPWEDRHIGTFAPLDAFVVAPSGFGNLSYREAGEQDVMALRDWAVAHLPIDQDRVYITGLSMGGTGTAHIALRYPDSFTAAAPLCGYHSYAFRSDMSGRVLRPWEKALSEYWSTVSWAENGLHLPLYVVHGKKDLPIKNSGVLIDRYHALGYPITEEHPDLGHNVWQSTYEGFKAFRWLNGHRRTVAPRRVEFKTSSWRYLDHAWVHIEGLAEQLAWARVSARAVGMDRIVVGTRGVTSLRLDPPASIVDRTKPVVVVIDGDELRFPPGQPLEMHDERGWQLGLPKPRPGWSKHRGSSGPITDAFHEPLVFVYGTRDDTATRLNHEVAVTLAHPGFGVEARWPVLADVEVDDAMAASHNLFLVGNAKSNSYLSEIEAALPVHVDGEAIVLGTRRYEGRQLGACFIHPNPKHPDRYVVVLEGVDITGVLRGLSLPRLLPDYVVFDDRSAGARGQMVFGAATVLAGGMFDASWRVAADRVEHGGLPRVR